MYLKKRSVTKDDAVELFNFSHTTPCELCNEFSISKKNENDTLHRKKSTQKYNHHKHTTKLHQKDYILNNSYSTSQISRKHIHSYKQSTLHPNMKEPATKFLLESVTEQSIEMQSYITTFTTLEEVDILTKEEFLMKTVTEEVNKTPFHYKHVNVKKTSQKGGINKPAVFILNDTGRKVDKLNETVLGNIVNKTFGKSIEDVNLEYVDLNQTTEQIEHQSQEDSIKPDNGIKSFLPPSRNNTCVQSDFEQNRQCICDIDQYLKTIDKKRKININNFSCNNFINLQKGILIGNNTEPLNRRKRSLLYMSMSKSKTNVIESDIDNIFKEDFELIQNEYDILALPGGSVQIPCHNKVDMLLSTNDVTYSWEFKSYATRDEEPLPGGNNVLPIYKLDLKDAGNYSCVKLLSDGTSEKYIHELEIISFPIYKLKMAIYYSLNNSCTLNDGDILYSYLPKIFGALLCGESLKTCSVNIDRPICFSKYEESFLNISVTTKMNPVKDILGVDTTDCNINCKMKAYANLVGLTHKNAEMVQKADVISTLGENLKYVSMITNKKNENGKPHILVTCPGGFGIEKSKQRVCVLCPRHTFSGDDEAFCQVCPANQYQPMPGSRSCLLCSSPVDHVMCLRMLYSDTKLFRIYVGVSFGFLFVLVLIIFCWRSSENSQGYSDYDELSNRRVIRRRRRNAGRGVLEPLLKMNYPPKVPTPDF